MTTGFRPYGMPLEPAWMFMDKKVDKGKSMEGSNDGKCQAVKKCSSSVISTGSIN